MESEELTTWESYEDVARYLLDKIGDALGLERVEGKQTLVGESGTTWEIDGKGVRADAGAIVVIECRRYTTSKLKQKDMAAMAFSISDVGASGGIVVHLDANSTATNYVLSFVNNVFAGSPVSVSRVAWNLGDDPL